MKRSMIVLVALILVASLCVTACSSAKPVKLPPEETTTTSRPTVPTVPRVDLPISQFLTAKELTDIVGVEMGEPTVGEQGAELTSRAVDSIGDTVRIEFLEQSLDTFLQSAPMWYYDLIEARNLGESAWYSPNSNSLIVHNNGYTFVVDFQIHSYTDDDMILLKSREIALLILGRYA